MIEPIKKPKKTPESFKPQKPDIVNMMEEASEHMNEELKTNPL